MKQVKTSVNGSTFEKCPLALDNKDTANEIILEPEKGFGGQVLRRQLEDLCVVLKNKRHDEQENALCYTVKAIAQGTNVYKILTTASIHANKKLTIFKDRNGNELFMFASADFDFKTLVGAVKLAGQRTSQPPVYTIRRCNANIWVVKKRVMIVMQVTQIKGLMPKFTSWEIIMAPGMDPAFGVCLRPISLRGFVSF